MTEAPALLRVDVVYRAADSLRSRAATVRFSPDMSEEGDEKDLGEPGRPGFTLRASFALHARRNILFGPSGAGKSTLLRLLAGLMQPDAGRIERAGLTLTDTAAGVALAPGRRGLGYLTQEAALFPHLSVERNIGYGLYGLGRDARRLRVYAMLTLFSLHPLACRKPRGLSGGERQRVALARALAPSPAVLLLDEPFNGLDAALREATIGALASYTEVHGTTVLSVSHDVAEVYASRANVLLLEDGRITGQGPSRVVLAPHRERLLAQLDASPPSLQP